MSNSAIVTVEVPAAMVTDACNEQKLDALEAFLGRAALEALLRLVGGDD